MRVTYCKKCNRFRLSPAISNYCKSCSSPVKTVPIKFEKFLNMSMNERCRLAYRLTNEYEKVEKELKENRL